MMVCGRITSWYIVTFYHTNDFLALICHKTITVAFLVNFAI